MGKKLTTEEFIERSITNQPIKYGYNMVNYTHSKNYVLVYCYEHNHYFTQIAKSHMAGHIGCKDCNSEYISMKTSKLMSTFIKEGIEFHENRYGYDRVHEDYVNTKVPVLIFCKRHKYYFPQTPDSHITAGSGCPICGNSHNERRRKECEEEFIGKGVAKHRDHYNYSLTNYINTKSDVLITCNIHKYTFPVLPLNHLKNNGGCSLCAVEARTKSFEQLVSDSIEVHGDKYEYLHLEKVNGKTHLVMRCKKHDYIFSQGIQEHIQRGQGCFKCGVEARSGENSHLYKHGKSSELQAERNTPEYREWKKIVKKDKEYCDCCSTAFAEWNVACAHHMNSWNNNPDERYDVNNGVTICWECHWEFHSLYGKGYNTKEQYYQFRQIKQMEDM